MNAASTSAEWVGIQLKYRQGTKSWSQYNGRSLKGFSVLMDGSWRALLRNKTVLCQVVLDVVC